MNVRFLAALACLSAVACSDRSPGGASPDPGPRTTGSLGTGLPLATLDPAPVVAFEQVASAVGIDRSREPASAGSATTADTYAYGSWLADLDGDGRLDYYAVNHGQWPHVSGLFLNGGDGRFGPNLFTVAVEPAPVDGASMGLSNEAAFVGDLTGDGRVDLYFHSWSGLGAMCVNQGNVLGLDWWGPRFWCYATTDALAFGDVNGDGRIDVLTLAPSGFDVYTAYYASTGTYLWRLNDGDPDIQNWPTTDRFLDLRVPGPATAAPPFVDLDGDGIPDKIVGIPLPSGNRGPYATLTAGKQVFLGRTGAGYVLQAGTGLEGVTAPITAIEDVDGNGCLDIGTDVTGYRDNQEWYLQDKVGAACTVTFRHVAKTALPYYPGFRRYDVDVDNSGLISKVVIVHGAYANPDGRPIGVNVFRRLGDGTYLHVPPSQSGIDITNGGTEFYADNLSPGDWDDDGRIDLAGTGVSAIPGTDQGFALWSSRLATTNGWVKVMLPTVTGFFTGAATIEAFDAGFLGDPAHRVTPVRRLETGRTWGSQVHHLGIGTRSAVDLRVTFPDGQETVRLEVGPSSRLTLEPGAPAGPVAVISADATSVLAGVPVSFDGSASRVSAGSIVSYAWDFGDGAAASGDRVSHAYATEGTFLARLTVTDDRGATGAASVAIIVTAPRPDLRVSAVTAASSVVQGASLSVDTTVLNPGTGAAGAFRVGIFLSPDAVITTSDTRLGTRSVAELAAGGSTTGTTVVTIPADATGTWYVGAIADDEGVVPESDEGNNTLATAISVVAPARPDLTISALSAPGSASPGNKITVRTTVSNVGTAASPISSVTLYLSTDATASPDDRILAARSVAALAPGGSGVASTSVTVPVGTPPGSYQIVAVVDPGNAVPEAVESNNARSISLTVKKGR